MFFCSISKSLIQSFSGGVGGGGGGGGELIIRKVTNTLGWC